MVGCASGNDIATAAVGSAAGCDASTKADKHAYML